MSNDEVVLLTSFRGERYVRRIPSTETTFDRILCDLLNSHKGKSIQTIGNIEISFG